ncbi:MAG: alpha/beta hydrolase, partial [Desulfobacterales bacterium]|nr:alpha/beta hydrolase [Desulfobacterales bacterium]
DSCSSLGAVSAQRCNPPDAGRKPLLPNGTGMPSLEKLLVVLRLAAWACLLYAAYGALLFLLQRHLLFPRHLTAGPAAPGTPGADVRRFWLPTAGGKVEAWLLAPTIRLRPGPYPVVIFAHGNGERIELWPETLAGLHRFGMGVLLVEYPGYGQSEGAPSQASITETFVAAYDTLVQQPDVDPAKILLFGRSLGAGAVCRLAAERPSAALILMSPFISVRAMASAYLLPAFLVRDPFDNLTVVRNYTGPVLIVHGRRDEVIPFAHGEALFAASDCAQMIVYDSGHNDCPPDWEEFWSRLEGFLAAHDLL